MFAAFCVSVICDVHIQYVYTQLFGEPNSRSRGAELALANSWPLAGVWGDLAKPTSRVPKVLPLPLQPANGILLTAMPLPQSKHHLPGTLSLPAWVLASASLRKLGKPGFPNFRNLAAGCGLGAFLGRRGLVPRPNLGGGSQAVPLFGISGAAL